MQSPAPASQPVPLNPTMLAGLSIALYGASLTQTAIALQNPGGTDNYHALEMLLIGAIGYLGGAVPEWFIWLANPLYFAALLLLFKNNKHGLKTSLAASLLAASFACWNEIVVAENGHTAPITSLEPGYYLWLASMLVLTAGWRISCWGDRKQSQMQGHV